MAGNIKVKIIVESEKYFAERDLLVSVVPIEGRAVALLGGIVIVIVDRIRHDIDCDRLDVHCRANLTDLWLLHKSNQQWGLNDVDAFYSDKEVIKAVRQRDDRIAKARRRIGQ
mgnify:CR=1 FL=1